MVLAQEWPRESDASVKRKVIGVLVHQHMRQQTGAGPAALDRARWQRRLDDLLAARAGQVSRTHTDELLPWRFAQT